jgi:hypothetical protein
MAFQRDSFSDFYRLLRVVQSDVDAEQRIIAENFLLEERLTDEREDSYGEDVVAPSDAGTWSFAHDNYVAGKINLAAGMPETFTDANRPNLLGRIDEDQYLVRVEELAWPAGLTGMSAHELSGYLQNFIASGKYTDIIDKLLADWNAARDCRPCFAGFWGEAKDLFVDSAGNEMDNDNWANELRDRFGLGHYDPLAGAPIHVLLLRYRVRDVFAAISTAGVFAVPTVLDSKWSQFFCPSPVGMDFGQTLDLSPGGKDEYLLNCEILHQRIDWQPEQIYRVGLIDRSPGKTCPEARKIHLEYFQDDLKHFAAS